MFTKRSKVLQMAEEYFYISFDLSRCFAVFS